MKKKKIFIVVITIVLVLLGVAIYLLCSPKSKKEINYECHRSRKYADFGREDIFYVKKIGKMIISHQETEFAYDTLEKYLEVKEKSDFSNMTPNDEKLSVAVVWDEDTTKDKKIEEVLEEIEKIDFKCKQIEKEKEM